MKTLAEIAEAFDIDIIYAFGSRAKEALEYVEDGVDFPLNPPGSDVDIGVKPARGRTFSVKEKSRLAMAMEDFFDVPKVDLVSIPDADPFVAANIIRGERLFAKDNYLADEYDLYILRRAGDLIPLERERIAMIMGETDESE